MFRGSPGGIVFRVGLVLLACAAQLQQSHAHGPNCDGTCGSHAAPTGQSSAGLYAPSPRGIPNQGMTYQFMPNQGLPNQGMGQQGMDDCPICRAEQQQSFAAAPNGFNPNMGRPIHVPSNFEPSIPVPPNPVPRQLSYPQVNPDAINPYAFEPYTSGQLPRVQQRERGPIELESAPLVRDQGPPQMTFTQQQAAIPEGMALVLYNDSPLMNATEQLGSIDRDQTLRVLNIQGNWVQLETDWLGKNAWIRRNLVRMNDNIQPPNDIAPPAT